MPISSEVRRVDGRLPLVQNTFNGKVKLEELEQSVVDTMDLLSAEQMDVVAKMEANSNLFGTTGILFNQGLLDGFVKHPNLANLMVLELHSGATGSFIRVLLNAAKNANRKREIQTFKSQADLEAFLDKIYGAGK